MTVSFLVEYLFCQKKTSTFQQKYFFWLKKNKFNENKIINDDKETQDARVYLTHAVGEVLRLGANLLGIEMPDKM